MSSGSTRRAFLRSAAGAGAAGLAGCTGGDRSVDVGGVTAAPVPSDSPAATSTASPVPAPTADEIGFWVEVLDGFTSSAPARLAISFWNRGQRVLTALDGPAHTLPFVDDDYLGVAPEGDAGLLLLPDDAELVLDPEGADPGPIGSFLPDAPTDGCWRVPFEWPEARDHDTAVLTAVSVDPGVLRRHEYRLYFVEECAPGVYRFEHTFDLAAGDPPGERALHRARLAFDATVTASMGVRVDVDEPVVGPPVEGG